MIHCIALFFLHVNEFEKKLSLLHQILAKPMDEMRYSADEQFRIDKVFPLIFLCDDEEMVKSVDLHLKECRATRALELGRDIKMVD